MKITPELKPLCANLKRLNIGKYLYSEHFGLYVLENNLDELWKACLNDIPGRMTFGPDYDMYEKAFFHLLNTLNEKIPEKFFKILLPILIDFAGWNTYKLDFTRITQNLKDLDLPNERALEFISEFRTKINSKSVEVITENSIEKVASPKEKKYNKVFIVHGHDESAKINVARFIEKLGFEPIILHEQASSSKTIIEKIEAYSEEVDFGIVLYTGCDKGCKVGQEDKLNYRARQNVVFEHGYLIGKIGRENVCPIVKGKIETPNDISGVVYVSMDDNEAWKYALAKEMKKSGYNVDMNKI